MSATPDDVAATTAVIPAPDGDTETQQGAESAPAVTNADEDSREVLNPVGKRIDELTRRRYDAERRADEIARDRDEWRDRALRVEKPEPVAEPEASGKTLADFGYDEVAFRKHLVTEARNEAVKVTRAELARDRDTISAAERDAQFGDREQEFSKDLPDYFEVTRGQVPITNEMAEVIKLSEHGPALAYHLGKNPRIAASIARLPPLQAARELGRLEAKLSDKPKPPQVSGAPPPAPKIAAGNPQVEKNPSEMTDVEFAKWRRKQIAQRH
jgi:hypothetical protein